MIAVREVVDPVEQTRDWLNAMHWLQSEPICDTSRIGTWGSSYSGGHVLYVAAHDKRAKAVFSQVGGMDSRFVVASEEGKARTLDEATRRARGELPYPEPGAVEVGALRGAPIRDKLMHYAPVELARQASHAAPMAFV
ncbi:MAG: prolyl oligopeptidase family serine peptidase [Bryobacterales bacterium]|nr:prolyl oligopeptidase family serine peptidase [Bryobacterales bacterium]